MKRFIIIFLTCCLSLFCDKAFAVEPMFITDIHLNGDNVLVLSKGLSSLVEFTREGKEINEWKLPNVPTSFIVNNDNAYITSFNPIVGRSSLVIVDMQTDVVEEIELKGYSGVCSPELSLDKTKVFICNKFNNSISEYDIESKSITRVADVLREPTVVIQSKDGKYLFVANFLPQQRADLDYVGCDVTVIDAKTFKKIKDIKLENGSNALRGGALSPDGKYLFISHNLGRFTVPTSQLQQGWMNTSAVSVVNTESLTFLGAFLVDEAERGAAGTWGVVCDDENIYVSHSGVHEVSIIDYAKFRAKFDNYQDKTALNYDLRFLYGIRKRVKMEGNGPREFVVSNRELIVPMYFSDHLNFYDLATDDLKTINLNPRRAELDAQKGERIFNDASYCFQNWQSCNGCHPGDGRTDGLNWDLMNDGIGNSKNCKSLLLSIETPPSMISGIRASANIANRAGFRHIQFYEIDESVGLLIDAYVQSLKPVPSPYLVDGKLSKLAEKGRKVYEALKCDNCHSGPYYTDLKMYRIGEDVEFEQGWDTPTLIEVWRTAPYLFDGRAASMRDVFDEHKHGINKKVSKSELNALVEYVNSL